MRGRRAAAASLSLVGAVSIAAGCGSGNGSVGAVAEPQPSGAMAIAVPHRPSDRDPLIATDPVDTLVDRQLYEPLVEHLSGPFDDVRRLPGLALSVRPSQGGTLWTIRLRSGVRFQNGSPLDASAVAANAERWRATAEGRSLLPGLVAADAPRPDLVRLILARPLADLRHRLSSPRLGIVSRSGSGTGPFELRRGAGPNVVLARNTGWWGTPRGLGPALDQVQLRIAPSASQRLRLLHSGDVEAAWSLPASAADDLRRDPRRTRLPAPNDQSIGLERSVRGIDSASAPPLLSSVWLTRIGSG